MPDLFAAIGTVGAFLLALWILKEDRVGQKREQAPHVAVWDKGGRQPFGFCGPLRTTRPRLEAALH